MRGALRRVVHPTPRRDRAASGSARRMRAGPLGRRSRPRPRPRRDRSRPRLRSRSSAGNLSSETGARRRGRGRSRPRLRSSWRTAGFLCGTRTIRFYLSQSFFEYFCRSQLPYKSVNVFFITVRVKDNRTAGSLCGTRTIRLRPVFLISHKVFLVSLCKSQFPQ